MMKKTIKKLDEIFGSIYPPLQGNDEFLLYKKMNLLGCYYMEHLKDEKAIEIIKVIEAIYKQNDLFVCNAIENEFLSVLARQFNPSELAEQLKLLPESLWTVYIKVLLETFKNNKL